MEHPKILKKFIFLALLFVTFLFSACVRKSSSPSASPELHACTDEAKICPDGSAVGRSGPNCAFGACPSRSPIRTQIPSPQATQDKSRPYYCVEESDCVIKHSNTGCGNPGCYNKDYIMPPAKKDSNTMGVCGFLAFDGCQCVHNTCMRASKNGL